MKLKLDENGNVALQDGKPVYVHEDGKEVAFDAAEMTATIARLNFEAQKHREGKQALEAQVKAFEGIEDPKAAIEALHTVANLDSKKLIDAGEVDQVKAEISKAYQSQIDEIKTAKEQLEQQLYAEKIGGAFSRSKLVSEKLAIPVDLVQAAFGSAFNIEDGQVVAYDGHGQKIYSRENPGALAGFDEALEVLVNAYPHKDQILKGSGQSGSGARQDGDGGQAFKRSEMNTQDKAAFIKEHGQDAYLKLSK